jgi:phosphatidylglycerol:prolipoprotein diacylglycerol transferase
MLYMNFPTWINPEVIPGLPIRWYGLMYLVAFGLSFLFFTIQLKKRSIKVDSDLVVNLYFYMILGLLLGARIFSALVYDPSGRYLAAPWLIFWPFENGQFVGLQGMSYHGGLIGAVVAAVIFLKRNKLSILDWGDMIVISIPFGYTFGRIGNFINGELYGRVTSGPWGMIFPTARPVPVSADWVQETAAAAGFIIPEGSLLVNLPRHPSQLYQAGLEGILVGLILWFIVRPRRPFHGFGIAMYLILHSVARFFAEYAREPDAQLGYVISWSGKNNPPQVFRSLLDISMGQVLSILMAGVGVILLLIFWQIHQRRPRIEILGNSSESSKKSVTHSQKGTSKRRKR